MTLDRVGHKEHLELAEMLAQVVHKAHKEIKEIPVQVGAKEHKETPELAGTQDQVDLQALKEIQALVVTPDQVAVKDRKEHKETPELVATPAQVEPPE